MHVSPTIALDWAMFSGSASLKKKLQLLEFFHAYLATIRASFDFCAVV